MEPGDTFSVVSSVQFADGSYQISAECDDGSYEVAHTECEPSQSHYTDELDVYKRQRPERLAGRERFSSYWPAFALEACPLVARSWGDRLWRGAL